MHLALYAHPFSSYCQKALLAFHENDIAFEYRNLEDEIHNAALTARWPLRKFPVLVAGTHTVVEATSIIEYLQAFHPGPVRLIPDDPQDAVEVRMLDRVFDHYISTPQQALVFDVLRPADARDPHGVRQARELLDTTYAWLDALLADGRTWAAGEAFSLADCAAAPSLFYADWSHAIPPSHTHLHAYRARLLARPAFARLVDDARQYRHYFPLGAPDRD